MGKKKTYYPEHIKQEVIRLKLAGELTNKEIMAKRKWYQKYSSKL
ncbi:hypothetical protein ACJROX_27500 [Pseudalkalibacillus sp. A8]